MTEKIVYTLKYDATSGKALKDEIKNDPKAAYEMAQEKFLLKNQGGRVTENIMKRYLNAATKAKEAGIIQNDEFKSVYDQLLSANSDNLIEDEYYKAQGRRQKIEEKYRDTFPQPSYDIESISKNLSKWPGTVPLQDYMPFLPYVLKLTRNGQYSEKQAQEKLDTFIQAGKSLQHSPDGINYNNMLKHYKDSFAELGVTPTKPNIKLPRIVYQKQS